MVLSLNKQRNVWKWAPLTIACKERARSSRLAEIGRKLEGISGGLGSKAVNTEKTQIKAVEGGWEKVKMPFSQNEEAILGETQLTFGAAGLRQILFESE